MWSEKNVYTKKNIPNNVIAEDTLSRGKLNSWIIDAFSKQKVSVLDAGCGIGYGMSVLLSRLISSNMQDLKIDYYGVDLIDVSGTKEFILDYLGDHQTHPEIQICVEKRNMNDIDRN